MQSEKVVRVTVNGSGLPVPDQDPVSIKKNNQKVRWQADFDFDIRITGYGDVQKTNVGSETRVTSGTFADVKRYKYTIIANGVENDPDVEVLP
ncbi:MAG TPA: hypothetical protein VM733_04430 [Thermoanaerobaculia bacterium]|nr:hypothetical protein [Thermoanaerobaculia bacterium]